MEGATEAGEEGIREGDDVDADWYDGAFDDLDEGGDGMIVAAAELVGATAGVQAPETLASSSWQQA